MIEIDRIIEARNDMYSIYIDITKSIVFIEKKLLPTGNICYQKTVKSIYRFSMYRQSISKVEEKSIIDIFKSIDVQIAI